MMYIKGPTIYGMVISLVDGRHISVANAILPIHVHLELILL